MQLLRLLGRRLPPPSPIKGGFFSTTYGLLRDSVSAWIAHKAPKIGAALAYYTAFSLAPLVILILSVISLFMKRDDASRRIVAQISDLVGASGGQVVQEILTHAGSTTALSWSTVLSFLLLWVSASGAFGELQDSLNTIWEVPKQEHAFLGMIKDRLLSLSMVFVLGFFMLTSLVVSTFIAALTEIWGNAMPKVALEFVNTTISVVIIAALFATVFKMLPDVKLTWRDVGLGSVFTAVLFVLGKFALGFYIAHSNFASNYGQAASFIVILVWVFYSAQILYFGAEFTRAWSRRFGTHQDHIGADSPPLKDRVETAAPK
jgi:membrane protein